MTSNDTRKQDLADAKAWLCARWHQKHPNEQHIIQLADYAAHLRATPKPPAGGDAGELAAFGASDAACTLYPGEGQAAERAAFVAGAALALPAPVVEGDADKLRGALRDLEAACDDLAANRSRETYLNMIHCDRATPYLEALDEARRNARAALSKGRSHG